MTSSTQLALLYKALGDETRLRIMHLLCQVGELCVCDLEDALDITQSKTSRHLRVLREAGLVSDRRDGAWIYYRVHDDLNEASREAVSTLKTTFGRSQQGRKDIERAKASRRSCS